MSIFANGTHNPALITGKTMNIISSEPGPMEKLNWLIHIFHVRGEITTCKSLIKGEIEKSKGRNEFAYFKQAIILREDNKVLEALESFQLCHKLNSGNVDNIKEIGKCLYILRRYRLSLEAYLEAEKISIKPDWDISHNIGECYVRLGDISKAKEHAHRAVQLGKQEISYALLIKILTSESDYRSAVAVCNAAIDACPDSVRMLTDSGILYLKMVQTQHAFERLSSALALEPTNPKALLGIGCITQNHEEFDVALSKYKIAVQTDSDSVALWNNIGMCFYAKQKYIAAVTCLKRALWLSPLNWRVLLNLGLVHLSTKQPASAFNFICAAVNIRPDVAVIFMVLGCALLELNDVENALRALQQARTLNPDDGMILVNISLCLFLTRQLTAASEMLAKCKNIPETLRNNEINTLYERLRDILSAEQKVVGSSQPEFEDDIIPASNDLTQQQLGPDEV